MANEQPDYKYGTLDRWRDVLVNAAAVFIMFGAIGLIIRETQSPFESPFYYNLSENMLFSGALLSAVVGFSQLTLDTRLTVVKRLLTVVLTGSCTLAILVLVGHYSAYDLLISVALVASVIVLARTLFGQQPEYQRVVTADATTIKRILFIGVAIFDIGLILRLVLPGNIALTWVIAPVSFLLLPGLSVGAILLDEDVTLLERFAIAFPLSIGLQFLSLMWLSLVGFSVSEALLYLVTGLFILLGLLGFRTHKFQS